MERYSVGERRIPEDLTEVRVVPSLRNTAKSYGRLVRTVSEIVRDARVRPIVRVHSDKKKKKPVNNQKNTRVLRESNPIR